MTRNPRPRDFLGLAAAVLVPLAVAACNAHYPNSTFLPTTEFNRDVTSLWNQMMVWATIVFVITESILVYTIVRFRRRPNGPEPTHVHGNTLLEISWTLAPALILGFIAVPTVRTIFKTQRPAQANALQVEVIGHQWWWEFRYPEYGVVTANELYLVQGRPVNFALRTVDVLHSFWIPALSGKRDLIANRTNYLWFTPDSTGEAAFNGSCNEYCGSSHANMKFRVFTVAPDDFASWATHQKSNAVFPPPRPAEPVPAPPMRGVAKPVSNPAPAQSPPVASAEPATMPWRFPSDKLPAHVIPQTPLPAGLSIADNVVAGGDAQRGLELYSGSACIGCHKIRGNPMSIGVTGPDLTHVASRFTIAGGLFPNDAKHLAHWIKNARAMKPGAIMPTLGMNEHDPIMNMKVSKATGGLTDQQIADVVAYLNTLK